MKPLISQHGCPSTNHNPLCHKGFDDLRGQEISKGSKLVQIWYRSNVLTLLHLKFCNRLAFDQLLCQNYKPLIQIILNKYMPLNKRSLTLQPRAYQTLLDYLLYLLEHIACHNNHFKNHVRVRSLKPLQATKPLALTYLPSAPVGLITATPPRMATETTALYTVRSPRRSHRLNPHAD